MINPIDRLPIVFKELIDNLVAWVKKHIWWIILFVTAALLILYFASTHDFIISCQPFSTDSGISCPKK